MKHTLKLMAVMVLTVFTIQANANESSLKVKVLDEKKFSVEVTNIHGKAVSYVKDAENKVVFRKRIKDGSKNSVVFDVSRLEVGSFTLIVEDEVEKKVVPFSITEDGVEIHMEDFQRVFYPKLIQDNSDVFVKLLSNESNDLSINIESKSGELLFDEKIDGQLGLIGKRFKFTSGQYYVTLSSDGYFKRTLLLVQ